MSQTQPIAPPGQPAKPAQAVDERLRKSSFLTEAMRRPELGAIAGLIVVLIFFFFTASPTMFTLSGMMTILRPTSRTRNPGHRRRSFDDRRRIRLLRSAR